MTMTEEKMDELAGWQIDSMDSDDIFDIVVESLKEYWKQYPDDFDFQWEEYQTLTGESYEDRD